MKLLKVYVKPKYEIQGEIIEMRCKKCGSKLIKVKEDRPDAYGCAGDETVLLCPQCDF